MAITRAQQFRQMLKQGSKPVEQAGVMNYMPSEMVTVPKIAKSSPDTPTAKLAYITPKEEDILVDLNLYGSLNGKPNKGPGGIPSLEGDFGSPTGQASTGAGTGGSYSEAGTGRGVGKSTDKDVSAFTDQGTGKYEVSTRPEDRKAVSDYIQGKMQFQKGKKPSFFTGPGSFKQRQQVFNLQQRQNLIDRLINQRRKKILSGLDLANLNPAYDEEDETFGDLISNATSIADMTDKFSDKTIDDVLAGNRQIDFFTPTGSPTVDLLGNIFAGPVTKEKLESLNKEIGILQSIDPRNTTTKDLMKEFAPNQYRTAYPEEFPDGDGGQRPIIPIVPQVSEPDEEEKIEETFAPNFRLLAGGGMAERAPYEGGIMDLESARQMYGLGKLVKKVTRSVKKIAKSPLGKAAILGAVGFGIPGTSFGGLFGKGAASNLFSKAFLKKGATEFTLANLSPMKTIGLASLASGLLTKSSEDDEEEQYAGADLPFPVDYYLSGQYPPNMRLAAEGGLMRAGYQEGSKEPVAKKTMPLLDMGGMEKDYREEGGFVPIGRMEKADDVPARLSKNEFVFTADAVRNAGDGDVDLGAEKMYNMMKNLEAGGDVSEESQGMDGARNMFQTSQRLEEVI